uniref:Reverse transcriptase domain-containing protein n=1 Tax=Tanacetum cinerariifolium TaxID=118510 RepID=A0A6L2LXP8_TANCI|nr:reverse transcriptase domain-containing protein [Tanacetum cinerariifolium]
MADQRTMAELLRAPIEGYAEAIVVPLILAEQFKLKHSLISMMTSYQFFGLEKDNPHDHIRWFNKLTSTIKYKDVPNSAVKLMLFPFSLAGAARRWLEKEPPPSILTWEDLVSKFINEFFAPSRTTNLQISKLTHAVNQQTSAVTTAMTAILKQFQATPPPPFVKAVEEICVTCDGSGSLPSNTVANPKGELKAITTRSGIVLDGPSVPIPLSFINPEVDERVKETLTDQDLAEYTIKVPPPPLNINITLADALILMPKYRKMLKSLLSNKEKLQKLANTPLNENCSAVILKKLPKKLEDPGKFLIPCSFNELKCKALADLGVSINLMPLSIWKKLGLPELISTRMTLELANRAICTPAGIARDIFSSPYLRKTFLTDRSSLIDVHGEEMILRDGDDRLTLNMRHDTSSYSNQPQKESINLINVFNHSSEDFFEDLFSTNQPSGNPTFSSHPELTFLEVKDDIFDPKGGNVLLEKLLDLDFTKDLHPPHHVNPLSGSNTYSSSPNQLLKEFADELTLITFPPEYDNDLHLKDSIDQSNLADLNENLVDSMPEMFTDEHALDYSSSLIYDEYDDDLFEVESDTKNVYDDPFDSKEEKIKESKLLIDELDLPYDFLLPFEYDSFISEDFSKLAISNASLMFADFDPPLYELPFFKEVPRSNMLLPFSSKNEEKVFKPGVHTYGKVHSSFIPELSHQGYKIFKINQNFKILMKNFLFSCGKDTHILAVPCLYFYPLDQSKKENRVKLSDLKQALLGRHPMLILKF